MMSRQLMRRRPSAESAWQRRILFGRRYFLFDKRHKTPIYLIQGQVRSTQLVIRLISWRLSAMINAHNWPQKAIEAIFDENLSHIMCQVIIVHLFWCYSQKIKS